ncbi:MAG: hypothetical protein M3N17_06335 [Actinomycetota bacterium]|nr:hypothetical protein [Actinomycetota bacterium]
MTGSAPAPTAVVLEAFEDPWRDHTPVFGCCRKAVRTVAEHSDLVDVAAGDVTARVRALRGVVDEQLPGHLETHRCCAGHIADLAFDLPELLARRD